MTARRGDTLDALIRNACLAADEVAIGFQGTAAEKTRAVIERALEALIANGQITVVPIEDWPHWYIPAPPYELPGALRSEQATS